MTCLTPWMTTPWMTPFLDKYFIVNGSSSDSNTQTAQTQDPRGNQGTDQDAGGQGDRKNLGTDLTAHRRR